MLNDNKIVGFVPTKDPQAAKSFYLEVLGLEFSNEDQFALEVKAGGNRIRISKAENFQPLPFTILGWEVLEIDRVATRLKNQGVRFERYSFMKQNEIGIWDSPSGSRVAWFKDPDGNLLSISQHPK
jgi:predicted enzyme related to lactoylglutathione lyase